MTSPGAPHRGRPARRRWVPVVIVSAVVAALAVIVMVTADRLGPQDLAGRSAVSGQAATASYSPSQPAGSSGSPGSSGSSVPSRSSSAAVRTPEGMWWGVDSTAPIDASSLANVRGWYRGARPQIWGRYLGGSFAVTSAELAYARAHHIYVYLIVPDQNCSGCSGGDACGNDMTVAQARADALIAVSQAHRVGLAAGAVLYKDIEQVSSCRGEPSADFLLTWHRTLRGTGYRTGFYGNVHKQYYDFPTGYCAAVSASTWFRDDVVLDMNEDEPLIGAPRGSTGPHNAPRFMPNSPSCAPAGATTIWQYGESRDDTNYTDIDLARPDTPGLLAPDGSVTG